MKLVSDILKKINIESSKPILTLIEERLKWEKDNLSEFDNPTYFQRMVDSSHYLIFIRPDIICEIEPIKRFMSLSTSFASNKTYPMANQSYAKYWYGHANKIELIWFSYSDVEKEKSSSGYSFNLGLEVLSWPSKKR